MGDLTRNLSLTRNFSKGEFACRCGNCKTSEPHMILTKYVIDLAKQLQALRDWITEKEGREVRIISHCGIRCAAHNKAVGGAQHSRHLPVFYVAGQGAFDCHAHGMSNWKFRRYVKQAWKLGIITGGCGLYRWGIHTDTSSRRYWGLWKFWAKL